MRLKVYKCFLVAVLAAVILSLVLLHAASDRKRRAPSLPADWFQGQMPGAIRSAFHAARDEAALSPARYLANFLRRKSSSEVDGSVALSSDDYRWQAVNDANGTFVYSAYFDDLGWPPVLRVIAIIVDHLNDSDLTCLYYASFPLTVEDRPYLTRRVKQLQYIPEPDWKYKYRGAFLNCPVMLGMAPPKAVSIVTPDYRQAPANAVPVRWATRGGLRYNITRCIPALQSNFSRVTALLEMFAFSQKFGVDHFIMYVMNASESALRVMDLYRQRGLVEVYQWNLPVSTKDIHYYGQMSNMQDCLYRSLHVSRYVLIGDVDEMFVPRQGTRLLPLLERRLHGSLVCGALQFINVFFPRQLPDTPLDFPGKQLALRYNMSTLLKTTAMTDPTVDRQKMALDPTRVETTYIHDASKFRPGFTKCIANESYIALHHYRTLTHPGDLHKLQMGAGVHLDYYLHQFAQDIMKHVGDDLQALDWQEPQE